MMFRLLTALTLTLFFSLPATAADKVTLKEIVVANTRDELMLYCKVKDAFTDKISDALGKGVPASISFYIYIYQKKDAWLNKKMVEMEVKSTLKYSALKEAFTVIRPWVGDKPVVTVSLEEAKALVSDLYALPIISLHQLEKGEQYEIRIKAEMNGDSPPPYAQYLVLFASMWNVKTDWYKINLIY